MSLPKNFQFSQSSLQDFETCARRFELRYLQQLSWPASEAEPAQEVERLARLGADFHRLVHQHLLGIAEDTLNRTLTAAEPELKIWWQNYLDHRPALNQAKTYPELTLSTPLGGYRLLARFDLLAAQPDGVFLLIDWKTTGRKPAPDSLARRMQTRVYLYVLAMAGAAFNRGRPIDPAVIKMMYWYPQAPDEPEIFDYSPQMLRRDEQFLSDLVEQVKSAATRDNFPLVEDQAPCHYCIYRSFCDRGDKAGPLVELPEELQETVDVLALDWDQVAEIEF
ncbi:MAG: PD-(D/E)XK nuclease family protein [Anaerolineae bacterium]|nr:PD-(D/E)XK nuclease family protein [Anaerolineae bacterium]